MVAHIVCLILNIICVILFAIVLKVSVTRDWRVTLYKVIIVINAVSAALQILILLGA